MKRYRIHFHRPLRQSSDNAARTNRQIQRRRARVVLLTAVLAALLLSDVEVSRQIDTGNLIRIHVLANSDSARDQQLKLQVKDAVVRALAPKLSQSASIEESRAIIRAALPDIRRTAVDTLRQAGARDDVTLQYGQFDFPVKYYGGFSLPAGRYEALRILIGDGAGHNWWCVLFPPLCFTDSSVSTSGKYTDDAPAGELVVKFRSVELLKQWTSRNDDTQEDAQTDAAVSSQESSASTEESDAP